MIDRESHMPNTKRRIASAQGEGDRRFNQPTFPAEHLCQDAGNGLLNPQEKVIFAGGFP